MKKIFTLLAGVLFAVSASAQMISFTEADKATGGLNGKVYSNGSFVLTCVDEVAKMAIDANNSYFGTADENQKFEYRLKSGGKSQFVDGKYNQLELTIPAAGHLKVYARTGSNSAEDRNLVINQNGVDLYNQVVKEADAVKVTGMDADDPSKETNIYPVIEVEVQTGQVVLTYPIGSMNFYGFEFVEDGSILPPTPADPHAAQQWDFTTISDADVALLDADATNWKKSVQGEEPNQFNRYENQFVLDKISGANNSTKLQANGSDLELTKDLLFGRFDNKLNANNLRIDAGKRIGLNGNNIVILINDCAAGDIVRIRYASTKNDEARGFTVDNGDPAEFTTIETAEQEIMVANPGTFELKTTAGVFVYAIAINDTLPEEQASGISAVKAENAQNAPIYNLKGERVDAGYRGVVIMNGKKMMQK